VILNSQENEQTQQVQPLPPPTKDFRLQAIRNLKTIGKPFDEYDLELEMEKIKKDHEELRRRELAEQEQERREKQARMKEEARKRQEIENKKRAKILILLAVFFFAAIYFLNNRESLTELLEIYGKTKSGQNNANNIEDILSQLVVEWNNAHSVNRANKFADLYHSEVLFYGQQLKKDKVCDIKLSLLQKINDGNDFEHGIGSIDVEHVRNNEYRCNFVKWSTLNQKTNEYPSYLIFGKFNNQWKIVAESDQITDKNLLKRKINEIRNFPEVKAIGNAVIDVDDGEVYYTARIGKASQDIVHAIYRFHIYRNYRVMYYDAASDSEMTIEEWRKSNE
jgi:hypothetical protein